MTVKFKDAHSAQACVLKMNGRFFDGRRVSPSLHSPNRPNARGRRYTPASTRARNGINVREPASRLERARRETRKNRNGWIISLSGSLKRKEKRARTSTRMFHALDMDTSTATGEDLLHSLDLAVVASRRDALVRPRADANVGLRHELASVRCDSPLCAGYPLHGPHGDIRR